MVQLVPGAGDVGSGLQRVARVVKSPASAHIGFAYEIGPAGVVQVRWAAASIHPTAHCGPIWAAEPACMHAL